jgi:putative spermidine/putrescine transport system substrate-binding protein
MAVPRWRPSGSPPHAREDGVRTLTGKRSLGRGFAVVAAVAIAASGCSGIGGGGASDTLSVIALPHDWCNYGTMIDAFKKKTGLKLNEINPNGGSGDEVEAIKANKTNKGPAAPDVIDVGIAFGPTAKTDGLLENYKVPTWDTIQPASAKDADGAWYGDYYGVLSFEVNTKIVKTVPKDWSDLLKPDYKKSVALAGDPTASNQAIQSVYAAALASGGSLDNAQPGLDFFKQLNAAGNFVPVVAKQATVTSGETPIVITWSYLALADRDALKGNPTIEVVIPANGRFGGMYAQAISKYAPHPDAAKKWEDYLYSDEGQLNWLNGYCYTTRYEDLVKRNAIPADLKAKLPDVTGAVFPSEAQLNTAKALITGKWKSTVGVDVIKK